MFFRGDYLDNTFRCVVDSFLDYIVYANVKSTQSIYSISLSLQNLFLKLIFMIFVYFVVTFFLRSLKTSPQSSLHIPHQEGSSLHFFVKNTGHRLLSLHSGVYCNYIAPYTSAFAHCHLHHFQLCE